jgi:hypothetical protein
LAGGPPATHKTRPSIIPKKGKGFRSNTSNAAVLWHNLTPCAEYVFCCLTKPVFHTQRLTEPLEDSQPPPQMADYVTWKASLAWGVYSRKSKFFHVLEY